MLRERAECSASEWLPPTGADWLFLDRIGSPSLRAVLELAFRPDRGRREPLYRQLELYLRELIETGRLAPGEKLPATREMATSLGLGRNTVSQAYEALVDHGLLRARVGQGTFVAAGVPRRDRPGGARAFAWEGLVARRVARLEIPESLAPHPASAPLRHDLRPGRVDASLPATELRRAHARALERYAGELALPGDPFGFPPLRREIARSLVARGIACEPEEVLVVNGAQQGLDLVARTLIEPGDTVAMEQPGYFGAGLAFGAAEAHRVGVDVDAEGLRTDVLARLLQTRRVKLVFTTPAVQSPTGVVMSEPRRRELLALADEHGVPVVEDDYDGELRSGSPLVPALKTRDDAGQVIYLGTFSKALLPGMRIGYVVAPRALGIRLARCRACADLHSGLLVQAQIAELLASGGLERHVRRVRRRYAQRLEVLDAALRAQLPAGACWQLPAGGTSLWLGLPPDADADRSWTGCIEAGIAAGRGDAFYLDGRGRDHLVLSVAGLEAAAIPAAVEALAGVLRRARIRGRGAPPPVSAAARSRPRRRNRR